MSYILSLLYKLSKVIIGNILTFVIRNCGLCSDDRRRPMFYAEVRTQSRMEVNMTSRHYAVIEIVLLLLSFLAVYYLTSFTPYITSGAIVGGVSAAVLIYVDAMRREAPDDRAR